MFAELQTFIIDFIGVLVRSAVFWVPLTLILIAWILRREFLRKQFLVKKDWVLLEMRLPKEISRSPRAMEVVLESLNQGYEGNWYTRFLQGVSRTWFSLEIVSIEGNVHFFIRTEKLFKNTIEAQIYAQFPEIEIYEADDYTKNVNYLEEGGPEEWKIWGMELKLDKPDPYPIKTYVDYGLDREADKDEHKVDPLSQLIEFLGGLGPGEQAWIQVLVQASRGRIKTIGLFSSERLKWKDEGEELVKELMEKGRPKGDDGKILTPDRTEREKDIITAVERSISKIGFDTGIRMMYLARKDNYVLANQLGLGGVFNPFNTQHLNKFGRTNATGYDFPWQDLTGKRTERLRRQMFEAYQLRSYFYPPYPRKPFVLNTEELATIYHFPGGVVTTPTLGRIGSKKVEPPADLPV